MKTWYINRSETGVIHRGKTIAQNKFICLTEAQAKLHGDKLEKGDDPKTILDCAFALEHAEWQEQKAAKKEARIERRERKAQG